MSMESTAQIEEEAAAWLVRRDDAGWGASDEAQLQQWLDESVANSVAFIRLEVAWEQTRRLKALRGGMSKGVVPPPGQWQVSPFFEHLPQGGSPPFDSCTEKGRPRRARWVALAAGAFLVLGIGTWFANGLLDANRYITPLGGMAAVPMSDGSTVTLNTASEIHIAVTNSERRVELKQGEAFFEVAKDSRRPFVVHAGNKRVVAVGTQFSVRSEGDGVEIVVSEGEVRVETVGETRSVHLKLAATRVESLTAGKIARTNADGLLVERRTLAEIQEQLAWRAGYLVFHDTALADAAAEFNRYNVEKIVIDDPAVAAYRVSGKFRSTSFEAFVRLLKNAFPIDVQREDARIRLSQK